MAALVRCKSCGYIMAESRLGDRCPACGVPRKMFEPWTDPVSRERRRRLDLDLHPIVVHFTVTFTASALALDLLALVAPGLLGGLLSCVLLVVVAVLPLTVLAAWLAGAADGKVRFRRLSTPLLVRKMMIGGAMFLCSAAAAAVVVAAGLEPAWTRIALAVLLAVAAGFAVVLSRAGKGLLGANFPG